MSVDTGKSFDDSEVSVWSFNVISMVEQFLWILHIHFFQLLRWVLDIYESFDGVRDNFKFRFLLLNSMWLIGWLFFNIQIFNKLKRFKLSE